MDDIYFITNRQLHLLSEGVFDFGLEKNDPTMEVFFGKRSSKGKYQLLPSENFIESIQRKKLKNILFYIHGFSNLPEDDIFQKTESLNQLFQSAQANTLVIPIIWPCDNDIGIIKDYWDDRYSAAVSGYSFARALLKFIGYQRTHSSMCYTHLNIMAHSMGNRLLCSLFHVLGTEFEFTIPQMFRNIFMVAPDVKNDIFDTGNKGTFISDSSRNVLVYYAGDDFVLSGSKVIHTVAFNFNRSLGHTGPHDMKNIPDNIWKVDCDEFNNTYDPLGHTYFLTEPSREPYTHGLLFNHMAQVLSTGRPSENADNRHMRIHLNEGENIK